MYYASRVYSAAAWWINRGFSVLPVKPNSKMLYANRSTDSVSQFANWQYQEQNIGVAVEVSYPYAVVDFDVDGGIGWMVDRYPEVRGTMWHSTPRGTHLFFTVSHLDIEIGSGVIKYHGLSIGDFLVEEDYSGKPYAIVPPTKSTVQYGILKSNAKVIQPLPGDFMKFVRFGQPDSYFGEDDGEDDGEDWSDCPF